MSAAITETKQLYVVKIVQILRSEIERNYKLTKLKATGLVRCNHIYTTEKCSVS